MKRERQTGPTPARPLVAPDDRDADDVVEAPGESGARDARCAACGTERQGLRTLVRGEEAMPAVRLERVREEEEDARGGHEPDVGAAEGQPMPAKWRAARTKIVTAMTPIPRFSASFPAGTGTGRRALSSDVPSDDRGAVPQPAYEVLSSSLRQRRGGRARSPFGGLYGSRLTPTVRTEGVASMAVNASHAAEYDRYEVHEVLAGEPALDLGLRFESAEFGGAVDFAFAFLERRDPGREGIVSGLEIVRVTGGERETVWTYSHAQVRSTARPGRVWGFDLARGGGVHIARRRDPAPATTDAEPSRDYSLVNQKPPWQPWRGRYARAGDRAQRHSRPASRGARRQEGLSMDELADRAGVHRTYIGLLDGAPA